MSTLFQGHYVQFFDDNGVPLSGGTVDFYEPGTSTPKDVYTDSGLSTPAQNPLELDAAGRATVWLNGDYKVRLKNKQGVVVKTTDNVNPPIETETSGGNLIANGSFEDAGNSATEASGWTLTAQNDGTVERITADNYDGTAALKFTSDGSGGGQADTNAFFAVSPGRQYEISFALKCSVADIRNIVQVRYFDEDQQFLSNSTVYDEDTSSPMSWEVKSFTDSPPSNARFAKLRILGADQSDPTPGEAKFDVIRVVTFPSALQDQVDAAIDGLEDEIESFAGWRLLESKEADSDPHVEFTGIDGTYARYMFVFDRVHVSETAAIYARTTSDGGDTWDSGVDYDYQAIDSEGSTSGSGGSQIVIFDELNSQMTLKGEVVIDDLGGGGQVATDWPAIRTDMHSLGHRVWVSGMRSDDVIINGVRFFPASGLMAGGTIHFYGWRDGS